MEATVRNDGSIDVKNSINTLGQSAFFGVILVFFSLFIFLYSWWGLVGIFVAMTFSYIVEFLLIMISAERNQSGKIGPVPEIINY